MKDQPTVTTPATKKPDRSLIVVAGNKRIEPVDWAAIYGPLAFQAVGCAFCHIKDDEPMMFHLPPLNYPGMRDSRVDMRLHDECHARLVKMIAGALGIHLPEELFT